MIRYLYIIVLTLVSVFALKSNVEESEFVPCCEEVIPVSINKSIVNQMSDLSQTKTLDSNIESFMRRWEITGASFALMYNDSLIYAKGYGYANLENKVKCEPYHLFRIASVSKLITATAIMKLVETGNLSLDDTVFGSEGILNDSIFLDLRDNNIKKIKVSHLLRHTAGFSYPNGDPAFNTWGIARVLGKLLPLTVDDMVIYATHNRLKYRPGGKYYYSNLGYIILGKIIEKVTSQDYESYVLENILHPSGCYEMYIGNNFSEDRDVNEVTYYEVKEATPVLSSQGDGQMTMKSDGGNDVKLLGSAGGWVTSSVELLRFVAAIDGCDVKKDILLDETIDIMSFSSKQERPIGWATVWGNDWVRSGSMAGTSALVKKQRNGYTWVFITNKSPWIGYYFNDYASSRISTAISRVKEWPKRDMFIQSDSLVASF